jgi:hypothetical protein
VARDAPSSAVNAFTALATGCAFYLVALDTSMGSIIIDQLLQQPSHRLGRKFRCLQPPNSTDPSSIIVGNGSALLVTSVEDTTIPGPFYLNNVFVTTDIIQNLLSVHRFTTKN